MLLTLWLKLGENKASLPANYLKFSAKRAIHINLKPLSHLEDRLHKNHPLPLVCGLLG
jgi:hypothetical protein